MCKQASMPWSTSSHRLKTRLTGHLPQPFGQQTALVELGKNRVVCLLPRSFLPSQFYVTILEVLAQFLHNRGFARGFELQRREAPSDFVSKFRHSPTP